MKPQSVHRNVFCPFTTQREYVNYLHSLLDSAEENVRHLLHMNGNAYAARLHENRYSTHYDSNLLSAVNDFSAVAAYVDNIISEVSDVNRVENRGAYSTKWAVAYFLSQGAIDFAHKSHAYEAMVADDVDAPKFTTPLPFGTTHNDIMRAAVLDRPDLYTGFFLDDISLHEAWLASDEYISDYDTYKVIVALVPDDGILGLTVESDGTIYRTANSDEFELSNVVIASPWQKLADIMSNI